MPSNVSLCIQDAFKPVAVEFEERFDVVHVRAFAASIKHGSPDPLISNILRLIKPGGYLCWDEFDAGTFVAYAPTPDVVKVKADEIIEVFNSFAEKLSLSWTWMAPGVMARKLGAHGFTLINDTAAERWSSPDQFTPLLRKAYTDNWLMALDETSSVILGREDNIESRVTLDRFRALLRKTVREARNGINLWIDLQVLVGRKGERQQVYLA